MYSMSCLEHIPVDPQLKGILAELKRIASDDALIGFGIGYYDHYATATSRLPSATSTATATERWRIWNPRRQHQNRLRRSNFEMLFGEFEILRNVRMLADESVLEGLPEST